MGYCHGIEKGSEQNLNWKVRRFTGADMMLIPTIWSSYQVASFEEDLWSASALHQKLGSINPSWPLPGGGIHSGLVPHIVQEYGPDVVLLAGGGLLGHAQGSDSRCESI